MSTWSHWPARSVTWTRITFNSLTVQAGGMTVDGAVIWSAAEVISALLLLAALVLMATFYREYLDVDLVAMRYWKLITVGFAFYIAVKTQFIVFSNAIGVSVTEYPWYLVALFGLTLIAASALVLYGFYGLTKDYL